MLLARRRLPASRRARLLLVGVAAAWAGLMSQAAGAGAMTVNTTGNDTTPGNGVCSLREAIAAVNNADSSTDCGPVAGGGTTTVNLGTGTYTLGGAQLQIAGSANIAIAGSNANNPAATVIDGGHASRIFEVLSGAHASITGLEITNGKSAKGANAANSSSLAGFGADGGGILNHGTLTLDHVQVIGNVTGAGGNGANGVPTANYGGASGGAPSGSGGGIFNDAGASLTVTHSLIQGNQTGTGGKGAVGADGMPGSSLRDGGTGGDGGYAGSGGGIYNGGSATIVDSTVRANATGRGGDGGQGGTGVDGTDADPHAYAGGRGGFGGNNGVAVKHNGGDTYLFFGGGGIWNGGTIQVTSSTISGNNTGAGGNGGDAGKPGTSPYGFIGDTYSGSGGGGGMGGGLVNAYGNATLTNVTVQGNFTGDGGIAGAGAEPGSPGGGGYGGGLQVGGYTPTSSNVLTHVTIAQNGLGNGGAGQVAAFRGLGAGISSQSPGAGMPAGTLLKNTIVSKNGAPASDQNCVQTAPTDQQNDFGDQGHDLSYPDRSCPGVNADPGLAPLGDNGGPTQTMVPSSAAAVGVIPPASCVGPTDQRGYSRPGIGKSACDIGAVETGPAPGTTPTTTSLTSSANPSTTGQEVTYTATVSPSPGSGSISFTDGGTPIPGCASVTTDSGQSTCSITYAAAGTHAIVASYGGNATHGGSSSTGLSQVVQAPAQPPAGNPAGNSTGNSVSQPHPPSVTATASTSAARAGSPVRFFAAGADPDPGDSLSYAWAFDDGATAGGAAVSHAFATAGLHSATVTVRDLTGRTATATAFVFVEALTVTKTADRLTVPSAGRAGFTISLANPGARAIALRSVIDRLPAGLRYLAGSAKLGSALITDPVLSDRGRTLTWTGPVRHVLIRHPLVCVRRGAARRCHRRTVRVLGARIPLTIAAHRTIRLHLVAAAPRSAGTYTNHATATTGPTIQVDTRAASARIRVSPPRRGR